MRVASYLHVLREPVGGEVDADLAVVDVGVLGAAFLGGENLDGLVRRADRVIELLRVLDRHHAVVAGVRDQERAGDVLRHVLEREFLRDLDAFVLVLGAGDPAPLEVRLRDRLRRVLVGVLDLLLPGGEVPVQRGERDAGGVALLEGGDARGVVAAEAVAHDGDALGVDLRALEPDSRAPRCPAPRSRSGSACRACAASRPCRGRRGRAC